ncbi:MAG: hypothetical protein ACTSX8_00760 [Alphaproteobacteria bacterium]
MKVDFAHKIGDAVKVKTIEMIGHIDALCLDIHGKQYRVVYWNNGERKSTWMYDWEIESA